MATILYPFGPWCDAEASGDTTLYPFGCWWEPAEEEEGVVAIGVATAGHATALGHAAVSIPAAGEAEGQEANTLGASAIDVAALGHASVGDAQATALSAIDLSAAGAAEAGLAAAIGVESEKGVTAIGVATAGHATALGHAAVSIPAAGESAGGFAIADGQSTLSIAALGQAPAGWSLAISEVMVGIPAVGAVGFATAGHAAVGARVSLDAGIVGEAGAEFACSLAFGGLSFSGLGYASAGYALGVAASSEEEPPVVEVISEKADSLRLRVAGVEVRHLRILGTIAGVIPEHAAGRNGPGAAALRYRAAEGLAWRAPGSARYGQAVPVPWDARVVLGDGEDADKFLRAYVHRAYLRDGDEAIVRLADRYRNGPPGEDVTAAEAAAGDLATWSIALENESENYLDGLAAWIDATVDDLEISANGLDWSSPTLEADAIGLGALAPGNGKPLYIRRTIAPGAAAQPAVPVELHLAFTAP